jgi:multiple sugar transport system ATP-binding protein
MVFQNYALYPHMTVYQNMALSLKIRKFSRKEINRRVREAAYILRLEDLLPRRPRELSGGQRQRVAMGRAIVREPQTFLMDEPLSNLDAKLRVQMRAEILRIQQDLRVTTIYVTHDQTEAMTLGSQVAVMKRGVLQQAASPQELYREPANVFVGGFIGSPAMNLVEARLTRDDDSTFVAFGQNRLRIPDALLNARPALGSYNGAKIVLGIRPEDMDDAAVMPGAPQESRFEAIVTLREDMGSEVFLHMEVEAPPVLTDDTRELASDLGSEHLNELQEKAAERRSPFVARVSSESSAAAEARVEVAVDTRRLYFFDAESGHAIEGERSIAVADLAG